MIFRPLKTLPNQFTSKFTLLKIKSNGKRIPKQEPGITFLNVQLFISHINPPLGGFRSLWFAIHQTSCLLLQLSEYQLWQPRSKRINKLSIRGFGFPPCQRPNPRREFCTFLPMPRIQGIFPWFIFLLLCGCHKSIFLKHHAESFRYVPSYKIHHDSRRNRLFIVQR